ncbi:MAG: hypothetical protein V3S00_02490, partial [Dehalococcoidia bacterium]
MEDRPAAALALLAVSAGWAFGWWRRDPVWRLGRLAPVKGRQAARALGSLALMAAGLAVVASIGLAIVSL